VVLIHRDAFCDEIDWATQHEARATLAGKRTPLHLLLFCYCGVSVHFVRSNETYSLESFCESPFNDMQGELPFTNINNLKAYRS